MSSWEDIGSCFPTLIGRMIPSSGSHCSWEEARKDSGWRRGSTRSSSLFSDLRKVAFLTRRRTLLLFVQLGVLHNHSVVESRLGSYLVWVHQVCPHRDGVGIRKLPSRRSLRDETRHDRLFVLSFFSLSSSHHASDLYSLIFNTTGKPDRETTILHVNQQSFSDHFGPFAFELSSNVRSTTLRSFHPHILYLEFDPRVYNFLSLSQ